MDASGNPVFPAAAVPRLRPGIVVHEPAVAVDDLLVASRFSAFHEAAAIRREPSAAFSLARPCS